MTICSTLAPFVILRQYPREKLDANRSGKLDAILYSSEYFFFACGDHKTIRLSIDNNKWLQKLALITRLSLERVGKMSHQASGWVASPSHSIWDPLAHHVFRHGCKSLLNCSDEVNDQIPQIVYGVLWGTQSKDRRIGWSRLPEFHQVQDVDTNSSIFRVIFEPRRPFYFLGPDNAIHKFMYHCSVGTYNYRFFFEKLIAKYCIKPATLVRVDVVKCPH